jgi:hypothetical protein
LVRLSYSVSQGVRANFIDCTLVYGWAKQFAKSLERVRGIGFQRESLYKRPSVGFEKTKEYLYVAKTRTKLIRRLFGESLDVL